MRYLLAALIIGIVSSTFLDDYLEEEEAVYNWERVPERDFITAWGSQALWMKVTSLDWR